jgi:hypothetical protein
LFASPVWAQNFASRHDQHEDRSECELAPAILTTIERQWRGWRVLHIADLTPEDQNLWTYARGRVCPGATQGQFFEPNSISYAIALVRGRQQAVVVARESSSKWLLQTIVFPSTDHFHVIWTAKPGTYIDKRSGRKIQALSDSIGFEEIGGDVWIYIRQKNRFVPVHAAQ